MNKKIKVLHILWSGRSGGAEKFVRDITLYADKEEFEHEVCFLSIGGWITDQMVQDGIKVYCLGMKSGFSIIAGIRFLGVLIRTKPHIIHNHIRNYLANILILFFANGRKIYFDHGGHLMGDRQKREITFYNYFGRFYDSILANSNYVKDKIIELTKVSPNKIKTFYIGIDPDKYKNNFIKSELKTQFNIPEENKVVGIVGRLIEFKGMDDFIKVAKEIDKSYKKCSFVIVGDGYLRPILEKMSLDYGVRCHFLGDRSDVHKLLNMFDIFLFTSKYEPFGIVVLEAMASCLPVLGFKAPGGMPEIIEKGGGGVLINRRNHRELAEAVINLLDDKERYNKLANEGYMNVKENFDIRKNIKKLQYEYRLIMENSC